MKHKKKKTSYFPEGSLIPVFAVLLILGLAVGLPILLVRDSRTARTNAVNQLDQDAMPASKKVQQTPEEIRAYLQEQTELSRLRFKVNTDITIEADGRSDLLLENVQENGMSLQGTLILPDGYEVYRSSILPPGGREDIVTVTNPPEVGKYDALVVIQSIESTTGEVTGQAEVEVALTVN